MEAGDSENIAPTSPVFAVYYPEDIKNSPRVFCQSVKEAAKFANSPEGRIRGARFRRFGNSLEASNFYESGDAPYAAPSVEPSGATADPVVAFPSVSRPDMNKLKKIIETDNLSEFLVLADLNPRYLINTSGDIAAIVQEGFRFNSLHIAARNGSALIAEHILMFVSDSDYLIRLYGTNEVDVNFRKENILISYLNTPDKGNGDTPLHIASKWGHAEVARVIASYRQTVRTVKNKMGEMPLDVVCSRFNGEKKEEVCKQLRTILNSYYVAVYKCSDDSLPSRWLISSLYPSSSISPCPSLSSLQSPFSPLLASFVLTAVAGPFDSESGASLFQKRWKGQDLDRRRRDFDRGTEKVGREMAWREGIQWAESWPFHVEPIDIKSNYGLEIMEKHLRKGLKGEEEKAEEARREEEREEEYEDANEEWTKDECGSGGEAGWSEGDSLGSLYARMQSLSMAETESESKDAVKEREEGETRSESCSVDGFETPPSSPPPLFLNPSPSKMDNDVFEVLSSLEGRSLEGYPLIRRFISSMAHLEESSRCSLPSLTSPRYWQNSPRSGLRHAASPSLPSLSSHPSSALAPPTTPKQARPRKPEPRSILREPL